MIAVVMATMAFAPTVQELGTNRGTNIQTERESSESICGTSGKEPCPCGDPKGDATGTPTPHPSSIEQACNARDATFNAYLVLPLFTIIAIGAWAFLAVTRRDYGEYQD